MKMRNPKDIYVGIYTLEEILRNADLRSADLRSVDLSFADLRNADLSFANLRNANLRNANLRNADLSFADLSFADLRNANLRNANLRSANLRSANLSFANLRNADLSFANLRSANLSFANLRNADLSFADLSFADLRNANLRNANLRNANLSFADLRNAEELPYMPLACPSDGAFIAWKKVKNYLVKLEIPASAKRYSATSNKCRASKAKVLGIYTLDGKKTKLNHILNVRGPQPELDYIVGTTVYPDFFDENRWNECSHGIHFFINRQDAINYI